MRYIKKQRPPNSLQRWIAANQGVQSGKLAYGNIPSNVLADIRLALLTEQGWLCAYTMIAFRNAEASHIEHVLAQAHFPDQQVKYANLLACHPGREGQASCEFGALAKGGKIITPMNFLSPLSPSCENRFVYQTNGAISTARSDDQVAKATIDALRLDHPILQKMRKEAVEAAGFTLRAAKPATVKETRAFLKTCKPSGNLGRLPEFSVALSQLGVLYLRSEEERAERLRAQRPPA